MTDQTAEQLDEFGETADSAMMGTMAVRKIGSYVVEEALGAGSFATVWQAVDPVLDAKVAIKVLAENWAQHEDVRRRFIEEARILRRIDDEAIVRVHVIDELEDGRPYFVMSLADNGSLSERLREGPLPPHEAKSVALAVLDCLSVVHDFGVVHRDIKPSNVFFRSVRPHQRAAAERAGRTLGTERVVLGDFGLAKDTVAASGFTLAAGTPAYMAPEQARSSAVLDPRADVYSVGVILYEMLAGRPPFDVQTLSDVRAGREQHDSQPLSVVAPTIPAGFEAVVERAMAVDPAHRFSTAADMRAAIEAVHFDEEPRPPVTGLAGATSGLESRLAAHFSEVRTLEAAPSVRGELDQIWAAVSDPTLRIFVDPSAALPAAEVEASGFARTTEPADADLAIGGERASGLVWKRDADVVDRDDAEVQLVLRRLPEIAAARAIADIERLIVRHDELSPDLRRQLRSIGDAVRADVPGVRSIEFARASVEQPMPGSLGVEARRILLWDRATGQLGLDADVGAEEVQAALLSELERWRGLANGGRIPFSSRAVAEGVISQLERLWLDVVDSSHLR